jgi:hypothetical protein
MIGHIIEWLVVTCLAWLFPSRFRLIPRMPDGVPLLRQFRICSFGRECPRGTPPRWHFSMYLQSFLTAEVFNDFHVHRWARMISFVLSGWFIEERVVCAGTHMLLKHKALSVYDMDSDVVHQLAAVAPRTWTLFIMLGRNKNNPAGGWGYYQRGTGAYRPWDVAIVPEKRIAAL